MAQVLSCWSKTLSKIILLKYARHIPNRTIWHKDQEYLYYGGTGYLGIHANQDFGDLVKQGLDLYGTNYGASRLGVDIPVFNQAEEKLAAWIGAQSSVLVSSGTLAGRLMLEVLGDDYFYHFATNAHVAIHPGYHHHSPNNFSCSIEDSLDHIHLSEHNRHVITFNSVDALTGTRPDLSWITSLPKDKEIVLIMDDSHAIGLIGHNCGGLYHEVLALHPNTIVIASLGKAMGLPGGLIAGPVQYISSIRTHPLFGGSSPMVPAYVHAYLHADQIYAQAQHALLNNTTYFISMTKDLAMFTFTQGLPVYCTDRHTLTDYLELKKIKISHFAYPSPKDRLYTRIIISALHTLQDLDKLVAEIKKF